METTIKIVELFMFSFGLGYLCGRWLWISASVFVFYCLAMISEPPSIDFVTVTNMGMLIGGLAIAIWGFYEGKQHKDLLHPKE